MPLDKAPVPEEVCFQHCTTGVNMDDPHFTLTCPKGWSVLYSDVPGPTAIGAAVPQCVPDKPTKGTE